LESDNHKAAIVGRRPTIYNFTKKGFMIFGYRHILEIYKVCWSGDQQRRSAKFYRKEIDDLGISRHLGDS
jgi:hypothetical protein